MLEDDEFRRSSGESVLVEFLFSLFFFFFFFFCCCESVWPASQVASQVASQSHGHRVVTCQKQALPQIAYRSKFRGGSTPRAKLPQQNGRT